MGGQPVDIGPWPGGLNVLEGDRIISDQQLTACQNFNIGRAGDVYTRTGLKNKITATGVQRSVDVVQLPNGYSRFISRRTDVTPNTLSYTDDAVSMVAITTTAANQVGVVVQHNGVVNTADASNPYAWFVPRGTSAAGNGFRMRLDTNAESTVAGIPRGSGALVFKERMFVWGPVTEGGTGTYRIYYSDVGDFTTWGANSFFDVSPGDGDFVQAIAIQGDSLVIFKNNSTWALYFDADPGLGTLRKINSEIGVTGPLAVGTYQNEVYVITKSSIYRLVNLLFEDIGKNLYLTGIRGGVDFTTSYDTFSPITGRPIFRIATGAGYRYFVYNYDAQAWSEYVYSGGGPDRLIPFVNSTFNEHYKGVREGTNIIVSFRPADTLTLGNYGDNAAVGVAGTMNCLLRTKKYSWGSPGSFKRLFSYAFEVFGFSGTYRVGLYLDNNAISAYTSVAVSTGFRTFIRFPGINRFRTVQFQFENDPAVTTSAAGMAIFGGLAYTAEKGKARLSVNS